MGIPSRNGDPQQHIWKALPHPRQEPTPAETGPRPAPPGFAPPLPRSRGAAHLHQRLSVSPVPTPGSRRGSRTSLLPPGQTRGQYIHPTETIQAVYDLGIKRGLQKGKMT